MKSKIVEKAMILFADKGILFSMHELAHSVGLKAPSIYNYYKSKEELLADVIATELNDYYKHFNLIIDNSNESSDKQIKIIFYTVIDYYSEPVEARFWRRFGLLDDKYIDHLRNKLSDNDKVVIGKIRVLFEECIHNGFVPTSVNVDSALLHFHMVIQGLIYNRVYYHQNDLFYKNAIDLVWDSFWNGLSSQGDPT